MTVAVTVDIASGRLKVKESRSEKPGVGLEPTTPSLPWKCSTN